MAGGDDPLVTLAKYLTDTLNLDAKKRRDAEKFLESVEHNPSYGQLLLALIQKSEAPLEIRVAGAVTLKNFIKRNWLIVDGETSKIIDTDRQAIKSDIIRVMLASPERVQRQISESVSLIGRQDFPKNWNELLPTLIQQFQSGDYKMINSCLQTAHALFKRYRFEMKSDDLWREIKFVLENFAQPLTDLFVHTVKLATGGQQAKILVDCLTLICKIFNSLNAQDLPEFFEDNMKTWMEGYLELLKLDFPALKSTEEGAGPVELLKSQICDNLTMYAQKYDEEFSTSLPPFVGVVWQLLVSTSGETKYDLLVANAIQFLASVCEKEQYKSLFQQEDGALVQICERVILPNMEFREVDSEVFEDNPEEFIRKDMEGSDVDTRRRSAADLVRALCKHFEPQVIQICSGYIQTLLQLYASDPKKHWPKKDAAIYLVTSLAAKGRTARYGTTKTSSLVDVGEFFQTQIAPDLTSSDVNDCPVLKADALKYLLTFRSQLSKQVLVGSVPSLVRCLTADSVVVHTYAAHALERLLTLRHPSNTSSPLLQPTDLQPHAAQVLQNLFDVFKKAGSQENEYAMRCVMRVLWTLETPALGAAEAVLASLGVQLAHAARNPAKPHYNHYLFESLAVLIKLAGKQGDEKTICRVEETIFPVFQTILQSEVGELEPYVFQELGLLLDLRGPGAGLPGPYGALFPFLLVPALWENHGNVPALAQLLQAYIKVGLAEIVSGGHLNAVLGVFQKCVASRTLDQHGFRILNAILEFATWQQIQPSIKGVLVILFNRLQMSKTAKFSRELIVTLSLVAARHGPPALIHSVDSVQPGLFAMLLEKVILADAQKISGNLEKKIAIVGLAKVLTEAEELAPGGKYSGQWVGLLHCIVGLLELPEEDTEDEEQFVDVDAGAGYSSGFSQLAFGCVKETEPAGLGDARGVLAKGLGHLAARHPQQLPLLLKQTQPQALAHLQAYFTHARIQFPN